VKRFVYIVLGLLPLLAFGAGDNFNPELFHTEREIEQSVGDQLRSLVSTLLEQDAFTLGVLVDLEQPPPPPPPTPAPEEVTETDEMPSDLTLGHATKMERALAAAQPSTRAPAPAATWKFRVKDVRVNLGLVDGVSEATKATVEKWLKDRVAQEFGARGQVQVGYIARRVVKPPEKEAPHPIFEKLKELQWIAVAVILAMAAVFCGLLTVLLSKMLSSKDASEQRKIHLKLAEEGAAKRAAPAEIPAATGAAGKAEGELLLGREMKGLEESLRQLVRQNAEHLPMLVESLARGDQKALEKAALLFRAASGEKLAIALAPPLVEKIQPIFDKMAALPPAEHIELLKSSQWDLIAVQSFGVAHLARPFSSAEGADLKKLNGALGGWDLRQRAICVLYFSPAYRQNYLSQIKDEERQELFDTAFSLGELPAEEVETLNKKLKDQLGGVGTTVKTIPTGDMLSNYLKALPVTDEVSCLQRIEKKRGKEQLNTVLGAYPTLAFIDKWPKPALKEFLTRADTEELTSLLQLFPTFADEALTFCSAMSAQIVRDELKRIKPGEKSNPKALERLREKLWASSSHGRIAVTHGGSDGAKPVANAA
jgi:flagellar motor switch protein FliG